MRGCLEPGIGLVVRTALDGLAAPRPGPDGATDPRNHGQRLADALGDVARRAMRTDLPDQGGLPVQILVTATIEQWNHHAATQAISVGGKVPSPYVQNAYGEPIRFESVLGLTAEVSVLTAVLNPFGGIVSYGREKRLVPAEMRKALMSLSSFLCKPVGIG